MLDGQPLGLWKERKGNGRKRNEEEKKRHVVLYLALLYVCNISSSHAILAVVPVL